MLQSLAIFRSLKNSFWTSVRADVTRCDATAKTEHFRWAGMKLLVVLAVVCAIGTLASEDYYKILKVPRSATDAEVRGAMWHASVESSIFFFVTT